MFFILSVFLFFDLSPDELVNLIYQRFFFPSVVSSLYSATGALCVFV